ncbi:hypothetical protein VNO78_08010 [Psophocarpus tetragonolobus]|uniref:Uncharacterized protein n=1 Tax=Psophocarpus tetragonolobus TaxID=3891 RepID=A0AAN9XTA9_PSOTE
MHDTARSRFNKRGQPPLSSQLSHSKEATWINYRHFRFRCVGPLQRYVPIAQALEGVSNGINFPRDHGDTCEKANGSLLFALGRARVEHFLWPGGKTPDQHRLVEMESRDTKKAFNILFGMGVRIQIEMINVFPYNIRGTRRREK